MKGLESLVLEIGSLGNSQIIIYDNKIIYHIYWNNEVEYKHEHIISQLEKSILVI